MLSDSLTPAAAILAPRFVCLLPIVPNVFPNNMLNCMIFLSQMEWRDGHVYEFTESVTWTQKTNGVNITFSKTVCECANENRKKQEKREREREWQKGGEKNTKNTRVMDRWTRCQNIRENICENTRVLHTKSGLVDTFYENIVTPRWIHSIYYLPEKLPKGCFFFPLFRRSAGAIICIWTGGKKNWKKNNSLMRFLQKNKIILFISLLFFLQSTPDKTKPKN